MQTPTRYNDPNHPVAQAMNALVEVAGKATQERNDELLAACAARLGLDVDTYVALFGREDYYRVKAADRAARTASHGRAATETPAAIVRRVLGA